jgi:hypothetical protein
VDANGTAVTITNNLSLRQKLLSYAASLGAYHVVDLLLDYDAEIDATGPPPWPAPHKTQVMALKVAIHFYGLDSLRDNYGVIEVLLRRGADVTGSKTSSGPTLLENYSNVGGG